MKRSIIWNTTRLFSFWLIAVLFLSACGNRYEDQLRDSSKVASASLNNLKEQLDGNYLINSLLIQKYAKSIIEQKPDYAEIAELLKKEGSSDGQAYRALSKRLAAVNLDPTSNEAAAAGLQELQLINSAADTLEFNNSLGDVVNTLASLSDGQLPVINVPAAQRASAQQNNALVGNPAYGNWSQNSSGTSFWAWYGMYSMFSNVFRTPYSYGAWSSRPHYSYYGNYGRNRWGSSADVDRNRSLSSRNPTRYNRPSASTKARYSRNANRTSSFGSRSSRSSSYGSSSRSSSYSSSRSFRSGK